MTIMILFSCNVFAAGGTVNFLLEAHYSMFSCEWLVKFFAAAETMFCLTSSVGVLAVLLDVILHLIDGQIATTTIERTLKACLFYYRFCNRWFNHIRFTVGHAASGANFLLLFIKTGLANEVWFTWMIGALSCLVSITSTVDAFDLLDINLIRLTIEFE